ncbi:MAG TPA: sigma-70 family RNA polymerase sigma factor [Myxococcota bacterium]|nr:sigma-70 family RNA polymerase sigma factor [Myxococcota bacterium]
MRKATIESEISGDFSQAAGIRPPGSRGASAMVPRRATSSEISEIGQLVTRLRPQLEAAALRVTREPEAASDVVQQAALKAIRFRHQFRGAAAVSTWLYRIVVNEALMWKRGQRRRAWALEKFEREMPDLHVRSAASPDVLLDQRRRLAAVAKGLELLDARDREVLVQLFTHTHSLRELTVRLGIPRPALRTRIFRARRRLEKLIETA